MRRLYPAGLKRPKDQEYRQANHRPSYQHGNPVQHRDIMTRICAWDKSANAATAVKRPEKITFAEPRWRFASFAARRKFACLLGDLVFDDLLGRGLVTPRLCPSRAAEAFHPLHRFGLASEAFDVLLAAHRIGRHDVPFRPNFEGARLERDLVGGVRHPPGICTPTHRFASPSGCFVGAGDAVRGVGASCRCGPSCKPGVSASL
jgi:hypothetical protein